MQFQHTLDKVLSGAKTQTRRLVKPGDWCDTLEGQTSVFNAKSRLLWQTGNRYAVQPARGKAAVARIEIVRLKREDVRQISEADARAEGFDSSGDFLLTWLKMHDKSVLKELDPFFAGMVLATRPTERYDAWAITFRLVTGAEQR